MYNYAKLGEVNEIINDIVSAFPAEEAASVRKELYNDLNFDNMIQATETSLDENTGTGKLLEIMMHTVDGDFHTKFTYIDKSKGDISRIQDFSTISAAINFINKIDTQYHYATDAHNVSKIKINNLTRMNDVYDILKTHKQDFVYGYQRDMNVIRNTYCVLVCVLIDLTCMNMIEVTNFMEAHAAGVERELPYKVKYSVSRNGRYLHNIDKTIKMFHDGSWNKFVKILRTHNGKGVMEDTVAIGIIIALIAAIPLVAVTIVYLIRFLIAFYFESAVSIRQKTKALAEYITEVSKSEEDPSALYKQTKAIKVLTNISTFISTKILKEDKMGMDMVQQADSELRTSAYISNKEFNTLANGTIDTNEISFE
jgi:hypothetical protein